MSDYNIQKGTCCCTAPTPGLRMLTFPDGTQSGVFGLDEILAAVYAEGMPVIADTAEEIVERLAVKNYIAPSVRQRYCDLLIEEYEKYVERRVNDNPNDNVSFRPGHDGQRRERFFVRFLKRLRSGSP